MKGIIISVNYNNYDVTLNFIKSLSKLNRFSDNEVIIINNSSKIDDDRILNEYVFSNKLLNVSVYASENFGYFGSISCWLKKTNLNLSKYDYVIICNNDIIIEDVNFFEQLIENINKADVIAPAIISLLTLKNQNPYRENKITKVQKILYKIYNTNYYLASMSLFLWKGLKSLRKTKYSEDKSERNIYSGHGSFMIFSSQFFQKGGYIDENLFLYGEEESITGIANELNMTIKFIPELVVMHDEHKATDSTNFTKSIYNYQRTAYLYIKNKYDHIY